LSSIHPTAIIEDGARIDPGVEVGPYCTIGPRVQLAAGVVLRPHVHLAGDTEIGADTRIFSFASIGEEPQDKKYQGTVTRLVIGERNEIREYVTIHPGTEEGGGVTTVGDDNLLMAGAHIAHDCRIGNHIVMSNTAQLAGHVVVEDYAVLSANILVHQHCRIGESSMLAGGGGAIQDLTPFTISVGAPARVVRVNQINLERRGYSSDEIKEVDQAFRTIFRSGLLPRDAFAQVGEQLPDSELAERMVSFLEKSERGFARLR
jgi:UDP-N-acetylglucosamine acyltransferase